MKLDRDLVLTLPGSLRNVGQWEVESDFIANFKHDTTVVNSTIAPVPSRSRQFDRLNIDAVDLSEFHDGWEVLPDDITCQ